MTSLQSSAVALLDPRAAFERHVPGVSTIGAEEELLLLDPVDGSLAPVADALMGRLDDDRRFSRELRTVQIEATSPVCLSAHDVERELASARAVLSEAALGLALPVATPVYPGAARPAPITDDERYRDIMGQAPWAARDLLTCGMHVHVGLHGSDRALAVANALRSYLPLLGGLAANSPFHQGTDAHVASARARVNTTLPRSGVPPAFPSWDAYEQFLRWGARSGVARDPSFHWFDLRLNVAYGTIEVRVFDVQTQSEWAGALTALTHALVVWLAHRHDEGETLPVHDDHLIRESAHLTERDGIGGGIVDLDTGALVPAREVVGALVEQLRPVARELGSDDLLDNVLGLAAVNGAERQRMVAAGLGMRGLIGWLADRTVERASVRVGSGATAQPRVLTGP